MQKLTQNVTGVKVPLSGHWTPEERPDLVNMLNNFSHKFSCGGTNGNHDVTCNVHDETGITHLTCTVADPAISGGVNVGSCITNNNKHLQCTIPPTPGVFGCNLQS